MNAKRIYFCIMLFISILLVLLQAACSSQITMEPIITITPTETPEPTISLIPPETPKLINVFSATPTFVASLTPNPPVDSTQQTWHATAVGIHKTEQAERKQSWNEKETQVSQFTTTCEEINFASISPDGNWVAVICGYKQNSPLIVQNKDGTKWVLEFNEFLSPDSPEDMWGSLHPIFWSPEGNYLFFTIGLAYDGGGGFCFPGLGDYGYYGLFRLNLSTGSKATLVASTDSFPGYQISFSPTGRRYAITFGSLEIKIIDLQTGKSTRIETSGTIERLSWSPDGKYLAYSLASCDEQGVLLSSSVYVWDVLANQNQSFFKIDGVILRPESWTDNSTLRVIEEKFSNLVTFDMVFTIYEYSIETKKILFTGTATPSP